MLNAAIRWLAPCHVQCPDRQTPIYATTDRPRCYPIGICLQITRGDDSPRIQIEDDGECSIHLSASGSLPFSTLPTPCAATGLPCEGVRSQSQHPRADPTSGYSADTSEPTFSASKAEHPNLTQSVGATGHWWLRSLLHHAETRQCISLQFLGSFIEHSASRNTVPERDRE